jgi:hypothetical protein
MIEGRSHGVPSPRSEIRRGLLPTMLGWLGTAAGMLAASTMLPDGCAMSKEQAQRLQCTLPWVGTIVFVLLGVFLARWLSSRKRFLALAAAGTVVALVLFSVAASLLYKGGLEEALFAAVRFSFLYVGLLAAVLFIAFEARRPLSGVTRGPRVVAATAVTIAPLEILFWHSPETAVAVPLAIATWSLTLLSCAVLLRIAIREGGQIAALSHPPGRGEAPYRQLPTPSEDPELAVHRSTRTFVRCLLVVALLGSGGAWWSWRSLPPPKSSSETGAGGLRLGGC